MGLSELTALELGRHIKEGRVTAVEAVQAALERIKALEPSIHAYVTVDEEGALKREMCIRDRSGSRRRYAPRIFRTGQRTGSLRMPGTGH